MAEGPRKITKESNYFETNENKHSVPKLMGEDKDSAHRVIHCCECLTLKKKKDPKSII